MTEEELKNKCKERAKIFQQSMESCKSSNLMDCIEWFADRITNLEKENAELKSELTKKVDTNHSLVEQMADLESENAELKAKNKWYSEQVCYKECAEVWGNLTKAKEIILHLLACGYFDFKCEKVPIEKYVKQAEQFLKEIEK